MELHFSSPSLHLGDPRVGRRQARTLERLGREEAATCILFQAAARSCAVDVEKNHQGDIEALEVTFTADEAPRRVAGYLEVKHEVFCLLEESHHGAYLQEEGFQEARSLQEGEDDYGVPGGLICPSGYGNGIYPVIFYLNAADEVARITITFN